MLISYSERHKAAGKHPNAMISLKTTIFALLLCNHKSGAQSDGNCGSDCAPNTAPYNLTCLPTGTFSSLTWRRGSTDIILCVASTGQCVPNFGGYNGYKISDSEYVLEILSLDSSTDSEDWICLAGLDVVVTCPLVVREVNATGKLNGSCVKVRDKHKVSCSGLLTPGTPQVDLQIKNDSSIIVSTNTELSLSAIERNALQNNYSCSAQCLTTDYFKCEDNPTSTPEGSKVTVPTTPTPGICKNHLYYLFLLLLVPIIAVVVWCCCCRKNKKQTSHTNTNAMHIGEQIESMSVEVQVNNDNSGQMRL